MLIKLDDRDRTSVSCKFDVISIFNGKRSSHDYPEKIVLTANKKRIFEVRRRSVARLR